MLCSPQTALQETVSCRSQPLYSHKAFNCTVIITTDMVIQETTLHNLIFLVFCNFWLNVPALILYSSGNNVASFLNLSIHALESRKVGKLQMSGSVQWLLLELGALLSRVCSNHSASTDSSLPSVEHFSNFHCLEIGSHWCTFLQFLHSSL
jgi:hypothetical protein